MRLLFSAYLVSLSLWAASEPKKVETYTVGNKPFVQTVQLIGTLKAHKEAVLTAAQSGILTHIFVQEGSKVKKGQVLASLDQESSFRKSFVDGQISLKNKKAKLERAKKLHAQGDFSLKDLEDAQNDFADAQKSYHQLEHQVSNSEFVAPFSGECGLFRAEVGSHIQSGTPVVAVYDTSSFYVYFSVPENLLSELKIGQQILVKNQVAILSSIENRLNPKTQLAYAKATLAQCPGCLIGAKVSLELKLEQPQSAISVPVESVFIKNSNSYVYRVVNKKSVLTAVKTGLRSKQQIAISSGLKAGDLIILRGQSRIFNDDPVY